ncbi:MAG TPA: hypothetical protein VK832_20210, partial [Burkholderiaceae bacterium]|nr:hypothetical protein [Burkholderiaceae bacterium]
LARDGELGNLLNLLEIVEHGDFPSLRKQLEAIQVASADFNLFVVQACNWMLGVVRDSHGDGHA